MARDSAISLDSFEELLTWLDSDRDVAASMYVQLRHDLARIFTWRRCSDPERLTDEVFDRVARKVHDLRQTYEGDPRFYFRAVANNLVKEEIKKNKTRLALDDVDPPAKKFDSEDATLEIDDCLQVCLEQLSVKKQELILAYYSKDKHAKIEQRNELAEQLEISVTTLRVRVYRIRATLEECIERCLERKAQQE